MKRITQLLIIVILLFTQKLFSEALFMPDQNEVKALSSLYTEVGRTLPANSYPVRRDTLVKWAEALYKESISPEITLKIDSYIEKVRLDEDAVAAELDWSVGYEHYFKTENIASDIIHDYLAEMPLGRIGGSFIDYEYGGACLELLLKREYSETPDNNFFISEEANPVALENQIVSKGYVFLYNDFIQLIFGRLPVHYGDPRFSSFMANENLPFLDTVKMDMTIADFRLEYFTASLENRQGVGDVSIADPDFAFSKNSIWTMMHRLVYSFDNVKISLAEQSFICRSDNQLYLGDFFPLTVWHNAWLSDINISMFTDATWAIFPGLEAYFQWGFDDINASDVFGIADSAIPTVDAFVFGLYHSGDIQEILYNIKIETGKTHYLWGSFDASNQLQKAVYRVFLDNGNRIIPFSSPYGPGAIWVELDSEIETKFGVSGGLLFNYLNKNTSADLVSTPYERIDEVMQNGPFLNRFETGAKVNFDFLKRFKIFIKPSLLYSYIYSDSVKTDQKTWFECTLGGMISGNEVFDFENH